jgi:hypothetical protein
MNKLPLPDYAVSLLMVTKYFYGFISQRTGDSDSLEFEPGDWQRFEELGEAIIQFESQMPVTRKGEVFSESVLDRLLREPAKLEDKP